VPLLVVSHLVRVVIGVAHGVVNLGKRERRVALRDLGRGRARLDQIEDLANRDAGIFHPGLATEGVGALDDVGVLGALDGSAGFGRGRHRGSCSLLLAVYSHSMVAGGLEETS
jgi:hypothetical protein